MKLSLDFAFEGFRIVRQKPSVLLFWGVLSLIFGGMAMYLSVSAGAPGIEDMTKATQTRDVVAMTALLGKVLSVALMTFPFSIILQALVSNAVFRVVLYDEGAQFGGLKFGKDELRQALVVVLFEVMKGLVLMACLTVASVIGSILSAAAGQAGIVVAIVLGAALSFWIIARLSLAQVQSFDQKRINLVGSWTLTKGHSSTLLAGYVIALLLSVIVYFLCVAILSMSIVALNGGSASALAPLNELTSRGAKAFESPVTVMFAVALNFLVAPLLMAITIGAPAAAYKSLRITNSAADSVF